MGKQYPPAIRNDYIEGIVKDGVRHYPTCKELAEKYNVSYHYLRKKCTVKFWVKERELFQQSLEEARQRKIIDSLSERGMRLDTSVLKIAEAGISALGVMLKNHMDDMRTNQRSREYLSMLELNRLGQTVKTFQAIAKIALGEPVELTKEIIDIKGEMSESDLPTIIEKYGANLQRKWIREQLLVKDIETNIEDSK